MATAKTKWEIEWWESERGWGQKPFSKQHFDTKQQALDEIKNHWDKYPDGPAPDYYIFPSHSSPYLVEVTEDVKPKAKAKVKTGTPDDITKTGDQILKEMVAKLRDLGIDV